MTAYIALLRAVNVGGTGKLPMVELKAMCVAAGFDRVQTYIASGNVVFIHDGDAAAEMADVLAANPFPEGAPNRAVAIFLDHPPAPDAADTARNRVDERIALGRREIYVAYGNGMASSKLLVPAGAAGTARNMNSIAKLAELAAAL